MAEIGPETRLRRAERAVQGDLPEETVLLDIEDGVAVRLNASGAWAWNQLEEPALVRDLARGLGERFGLDEAQALGDIAAFAGDLVGRGLLEAL